MARNIRLRHSLLTRLLTTSLLIALLSTVSTAWLVVRSTTLAIKQESGQVLADDTKIQDVLTGYAAQHPNWDGASSTVQALAKKTGRNITLTTRKRKVIIRSSRASLPLPTRASAVIDPLRTSGDPDSVIDSDISVIDERAIGPYRLPPRERTHLKTLAQTQIKCFSGYGIQATALVGPGGRPVVRIVERAVGANPGGLCDLEGRRLAEPTETEAAGLNQLRKNVVACAKLRGVPHADSPTWIGISTNLTIVMKGTEKEVNTVEDCFRTARREQLAPYVAPPALLFMSSTSAPATTVFDLSRSGAARIAGVTALVLMVTFTITTVIAVRLVRPLRALAEAAQDPSDQHARVEVTSKDETGYLAAAFNDLSDRRERTEEQRKALVSDIAHELRTPLTNIRGWLEAAQDGVVVPDTTLLSSLQEEAMLLQHIIDDLQMLSTADAGTLRLSLERLRLNDLLHQVAAAHRNGAEAAGVTILTEVTGDLTVDGDPLRLRQALSNLASNAIRHTPPGGTVSLIALRSGDEVLIHVTDTGSGIEPDDLPKVFDRFWRADTSRSRRSGGSGLGLSIVRKLVEAHQGTVTATSTPDVQTVFTLRLPARS